MTTVYHALTIRQAHFLTEWGFGEHGGDRKSSNSVQLEDLALPKFNLTAGSLRLGCQKEKSMEELEQLVKDHVEEGETILSLSEKS